MEWMIVLKVKFIAIHLINKFSVFHFLYDAMTKPPKDLTKQVIQT